VIAVGERERMRTVSPSPVRARPGEWGWYLYGITRPSRDDLTELNASDALNAGLPLDEHEPVRLLDCGDLAAVVRRISLAEFSDEALERRLRDLDALAELAGHHNAVIAAVHQRQTILPAKFGHVYPNSAALRAAIRSRHDASLAQLEQLDGCDEWAVHVYADPDAIRARLAAERPTVGDARSSPGSTSPGRAYLLQRKLATQLDAMSEQALSDLARGSFDRLADLSVLAEVSPAGRSRREPGTPREVLRATFLVSRAAIDPFLAAIGDIEQQNGVRCTTSGPWPPYSFAALPSEGA